eukprot:PhM_4_TR7562/c1_g1_i1/m.72166
MSNWQNSFASYFDRYIHWMRSHGQMARMHASLVNAPTTARPHPAATAPLNSRKNRFHDVLPFADTAVVLGDGGYVNANYVNAKRLFDVPFTYIATQAPMSNTVCDFWRMVWEHNSSFVVMLTDVVEMGAVKCEQYWPALDHTQQYELIQVTTMEETAQAEGVYRVLRLKLRDQVRFVRHYLYTGWPQGGVPNSALGLLEIILDMGKFNEAVSAPIIVHCGGGAGRTGVFLALHIALCHFQFERQFVLDSILATLRRCRPAIGQRADHYEFAYDATLECMARMLKMFRGGNHRSQSEMPQPHHQQQYQQQRHDESTNRGEHKVQLRSYSRPPSMPPSPRAMNQAAINNNKNNQYNNTLNSSTPRPSVSMQRPVQPSSSSPAAPQQRYITTVPPLGPPPPSQRPSTPRNVQLDQRRLMSEDWSTRLKALQEANQALRSTPGRHSFSRTSSTASANRVLLTSTPPLSPRVINTTTNNNNVTIPLRITGQPQQSQQQFQPAPSPALADATGPVSSSAPLINLPPRTSNLVEQQARLHTLESAKPIVYEQQQKNPSPPPQQQQQRA